MVWPSALADNHYKTRSARQPVSGRRSLARNSGQTCSRCVCPGSLLGGESERDRPRALFDRKVVVLRQFSRHLRLFSPRAPHVYHAAAILRAKRTGGVRMTAPRRKMATPALRQNKKDKYWVASSRTVRHAWLPAADGEGKFHRAGPDAGMPTLGLE